MFLKIYDRMVLCILNKTASKCIEFKREFKIDVLDYLFFSFFGQNLGLS